MNWIKTRHAERIASYFGSYEAIILAEVTNDLKQAKLRVSVYEEDELLRKGTIDALNHAAGFIARELGHRMQIRRVPVLKFVLDTTIEYSVHISKILNSLQSTKEEEDENA